MIDACVLPVPIMADSPTPAESPQPTSETVRVAGDLVEMLREIAFHSRDTRGKRMKLTQIVDNILRPAVTTAYAKLQDELKPAKKQKPKE